MEQACETSYLQASASASTNRFTLFDCTHTHLRLPPLIRRQFVFWCCGFGRLNQSAYRTHEGHILRIHEKSIEVPQMNRLTNSIAFSIWAKQHLSKQRTSASP